MAKTTTPEPAFALTPRGDTLNLTLDWLRAYFRENPDATLSVTTTITRSTLRDFVKGNRASLGSWRGVPRRKRSSNED